MVLSVTRRRASLIVMCILFLTLLPLNMLSGIALAKVTSLQHSHCSETSSIQPLSCLSVPVQTTIGKRLFSLHVHQQASANAQASTSLTVQQVAIADITGNSQTTFVPGEAVLYAAFINNTSSSAITATINFMVQVSRKECNFNLTGTGLSVPTGQSVCEDISDLCGD